MTSLGTQIAVPPGAPGNGSLPAGGPLRPRADDAYLWRATPRRRAAEKAPLVYLLGLGPHSTGRTRRQRVLQRLEVLALGLTFDVWLVGRRAPLSTGTTIAGLAEEHARAIRSRFDHPVDLVGESTGGSIALQLALDHPDVVNRLVLVSAAAQLLRAGRDAQRDAALNLRAGNPRRAAGAMLAATTSDTGRSRLLRLAGWVLGRLVVGRSDHDLILNIEAEHGFDVRHGLSRITAPTLLIGGARDGYYSPGLFRQTAALVQDGVYLEQPKKGHLTATTDVTVRRAIRAHLSSAKVSVSGGAASRRGAQTPPPGRTAGTPRQLTPPRPRHQTGNGTGTS